MTWAVYLHQGQFIPQGRVSETLRDFFGQGPSDASIATWTHQLAERFRPYVQAIEETVTISAVKHMDETGCRVEGKNQWMHVFSTSWLTHYRFSPKRGDVPQNLLGTVVHDHWKSYFTQSPKARHALCNEHHLRELKALLEIHGELWARHMTRLLRIVCCLSKLPEVPKDNLLQRVYKLYDKIIQKGLDFHSALPPLPRKSTRVRLRDYKDCVLLCLIDLDVPFTNNQGERDLRMNKVKQKISGCFRTRKGVEMFAIIRSMLSSARKQRLSLLAVMKNPQLLAITVPPMRV